MASTKGTLSVQILEARLERDVETFGRMDPYVCVQYRHQHMRTKTNEDGAKEPAWQDEIMEIDVKYIGDDMNIQIKDENMMCDDELIGEATVKVSSLCVNGGLDDWWPVAYKGKHAGSLHLKSTWNPDSTDPISASAANKPNSVAQSNSASVETVQPAPA